MPQFVHHRLRPRAERPRPPRSRLVVVGGWADGVAARAVKHAHLGSFDDGGSAFAGARGAALTAGRAAGVVAPL